MERRTSPNTTHKGVYVTIAELTRLQHQAPDITFLPKQPVHGILSGRYGSRLRGRGLNFEELKRYQPGDDVRNMDWKVTARTKVPHIRVYTEEKDRPVILVVDQRTNMFFGTRNKLKSVTASELAAISAWKAHHAGDRVGAFIFSDDEIYNHAAGRGQDKVLYLMSRLVKYNQALVNSDSVESNSAMLNTALARVAKLKLHDALVVIVSDFDGVDEQTEKLTAVLAEHNDLIGLLVHDPVRTNPVSEKIWVGDGKKIAPLDLSKQKNRESIQFDYLTEQETIARHLSKLSAPLFPINNAEDCVEQLRKLLGQGVTGSI